VGPSAPTRDQTEFLVMGSYRVRRGFSLKGGNSLVANEPVRPRS